MMNLALFDFDGTITSADMYSKFLSFSASGLRFYAARAILFPFYISYRAGLVSPKFMRTISRKVVFKGQNCLSLDELAFDYSKTVIPMFVREIAQQKIDWHLAQGDKVVVVSASLDLYLRPWCETHGIDLICNELHRIGNRFSGKLNSEDCSHHLKATKVRDRYNLSDFNKIYAYGDTLEDMAMLSLAHEKYLNWKKI